MSTDLRASLCTGDPARAVLAYDEERTRALLDQITDSRTELAVTTIGHRPRRRALLVAASAAAAGARPPRRIHHC